MRSALEVWEAALGELQVQVSKPNYATWLKDTRGIRQEDDTFVIGVPNAFVGEWLNSRLRPLIAKTLVGITGESLDVRFEEAASAAPPPPPNPVLADGGISTLERPAAVPEADPFLADPGPSVPASPRQPLPLPRLNPRYTFDQFVVGNCNRLSYSTALDVIENPSGDNPLYIHGGTGLGKTHLLHAIGHAALAKRLRTVYTTAEHFTNEYVAAVRGRRMEAFRARFSDLDVLLLDDAQFLGGREQTQECILHIFIELHTSNCRIVIAADRPPKHIPLLDSRLQSRFSGGLVTSVHPPDYDTRVSILTAKSALKRTTLAADIVRLIADAARSNVRELEGLLNQVIARIRLIGNSASNSDLVREAIQEAATQSPVHSSLKNVTPQAIIDAVSEEFQVPAQALTGANRDRAATLARQVAMFLLQREGHCGINEIGRVLGNRDHSTVLHGCRKMASLLNTDKDLERRVNGVTRRLRTAV